MAWTVIDLDNIADPMAPTFATLPAAHRFARRLPSGKWVVADSRMVTTAREIAAIR